jgi:hypothetical protein
MVNMGLSENVGPKNYPNILVFNLIEKKRGFGGHIQRHIHMNHGQNLDPAICAWNMGDGHQSIRRA